jgi:hypothetical protein
MKYIIQLILLLLVASNFQISYAQTRGRYIPTRNDTVKKVIPPQVYGNAKADSVSQGTSTNSKVSATGTAIGMRHSF